MLNEPATGLISREAYHILYKGMEGNSDIEKGPVDERVSVHIVRTDDEQWWKSTFSPELLNAKSPLPSSCCIFKVPEVLRRPKPEAYEPDVVSIGPFHRGGKKFQLVENVKKWYLKCLLARQLPNPKELETAELIESLTEDSLNESLDRLTKSIKEEGLDKRARDCYSDRCDHLPQNEFVEMLILDGCFLIELFRKAPPEHAKQRQDKDDPVFNLSCMLEYLHHDLLLLENQLPWFVLEFFYNQIEIGNATLSEVVIDFFRDSVADASIFSHPNRKPGEILEILHILDLIRTSLVNIPDSSSTEDPNSNSHASPQRIPSAATLSDSGVIFKKGEPGCILNIEFNRGVFTIPPLAVDERTGPLFRNLIAFEQCHYRCKHKITSYAVLMDNLIDTTNDVNLLCEKEILANWLSAEDAVKFFNDLYTDTTVVDFVHQELCKKVHQYHRDHWNRWIEKLKRDYFETPWSTISFFAAFVLLVLTFLQTIFTIQPYYHPRN